MPKGSKPLILRFWKLLEQREGRGPASLSEAGRTMLEGGFVLTPEEGVWRLFWIDDPLILSPMTHAVRIEVESAIVQAIRGGLE